MSDIRVNNFYNESGLGGPNFPAGANATGIVTATTFKGNLEGT